jgi:hypothetical protein
MIRDPIGPTDSNRDSKRDLTGTPSFSAAHPLLPSIPKCTLLMILLIQLSVSCALSQQRFTQPLQVKPPTFSQSMIWTMMIASTAAAIPRISATNTGTMVAPTAIPWHTVSLLARSKSKALPRPCTSVRVVVEIGARERSCVYFKRVD